MTKEYANKVYDILVENGGAPESMRGAFVDNMTSDDPTDEWRFQGKLEFGGKFWPEKNNVNCYSEDVNDKRLETIKNINEQLNILKK